MYISLGWKARYAIDRWPENRSILRAGKIAEKKFLPNTASKTF